MFTCIREYIFFENVTCHQFNKCIYNVFLLNFKSFFCLVHYYINYVANFFKGSYVSFKDKIKFL